MTPVAGLGAAPAGTPSFDDAAAESPALVRLWRGFKTARIFFGGVLLLLQGVTYGLGQPLHPSALGLSGTYLAATLLAARCTPPHRPMRALGLGWLATVGVDLATFALLQSMQQGGVNYTPLFALPVLMGAVLGKLTVGLATTAAATLLLLADAGWRGLQGPGDASPHFMQAALTGTGLFVVALLAHELALRLTREEALALRNRDSARMHAQVNELVIETLSEGVLVVDAQGQVHAANPAVGAILGSGPAALSPPFALDRNPAWQELAELARRTFLQRAAQSAELPIAQSTGAPYEIQVHTRLTPAVGAGTESLCVMFVQDLRELEARIRTEKLAAMGRMSAAVAHEIRNPLAAIMQAGALLGEDLSDPVQRRLVTMVQHNARRLARTVDDVLDVARVRQQHVSLPSEPIALDPLVRALTEEWALQTRHQGTLLRLEASACRVHFDSEHLRRILINLLDNAARYAGAHSGSIQVATRAGPTGRTGLQVWSDGAPLEAAVRRHLFEPFFSSESRSSGLGLFICRELCERHGAAIGYERRALEPSGPAGNAFFVTFLTA